MSKLKSFFVYWLPAILWMALIYFLSSLHKLQASEVGWQDFIVRKTAHFLEYAFLLILFNRAIAHTTEIISKKRFILALILTIIYAFSDEFHQTFVLGRSGRLFDFFIDSLGAGAGLLFVIKYACLMPGKIQRLIL